MNVIYEQGQEKNQGKAPKGSENFLATYITRCLTIMIRTIIRLLKVLVKLIRLIIKKS